ncbi:hypothetical protein S245_067877, partial [Arachis hypogaea]
MDHRSINAGPVKKLNWLDLPDDLTLMIIGKLTTFQILTSVQFVCRKWWRICMDPLMWRTINMCNIGIRNSVDYKLEKMCRHAIDRSCGQLVDISIEYFATDDFLKYIIDSGCHKLQRLRLVQCFRRISDKGLCEMVEKLPLLEELDITLCLNVSSIALEAIGRSCPLLKSFKFNDNGGGKKAAFAIAQNMSNLRHLQLFGNLLNNSGLNAILNDCPHLESLDLRKCYNVKLEGKLKTRCDEQLKDLRDPDAPCDDFRFWGLCFETAYYDATLDYVSEKRVKAQVREARRINSGSSTHSDLTFLVYNYTSNQAYPRCRNLHPSPCNIPPPCNLPPPRNLPPLRKTLPQYLEQSDRATFVVKFKRWWKGVNIFQKAYVLIPVHEDLHWSLIIICIPDKGDESGPIILHLDSLSLHSSRSLFDNIK